MAVSSTSAYSVSGLASGIDTQKIIDALVQVDSQPINLVQSQQSLAKAHLVAIQQMNTNVLAISSALDPLKQSSTFAAKTATSSNTAALGVTASGKAIAGTVNLSVKQLATADQYATSVPQADATSPLGGTGAITLQTNSGSAVVVTPTDYSLNGIAEAINGAGAGISAAVVNDGVGYRLLLTADKTGVSNGIAIAAGSDDLAAILATTGVDGLTPVSSAQDAELRLGDPDNGLKITSASNTVTDAIPGLTLTLGAKADNIAVAVSADSTSVASSITAFTSAFNTAQNFFKQNSTYDTTTKTAGQLFSDSVLRSQMQALRGAATTSDPAQPAGYQTLADIGVKFDDSGVLSVDSATLQTKLNANPSAVAALFQTVSQAVGKQVDRLTLSKIGSLSLEQDQLNSQITDMANRITDLNKRVDARKAYYQNQFNAMETLISQLSNQGKALTSFTNAVSAKSG